MEIYLLRHAIAMERSEHHGPDEDRPLTAEGRRKLKRVAQAMRGMRLSFDAVYSSPLTRALQTAEMVVEVLPLKERLQVSALLKPATAAEKQMAWLRSLRPQPERVLLVGHEPNFSQLTSLLLTGHERMAIEFKKAGLCKVTAERVTAGSAVLHWLLAPKQMARMLSSGAVK